MGRKLFIVASEHTAVYQSLKRALAGEEDVEIVYDRRTKRSDARRGASSIWARGPLADLSDRRIPSHVDDDLRTRGWAVVRLDGELSPGASLSGPLLPAE
jgi:hypothetical protein